MPLFKPEDIILNEKYIIKKLLGEGAFGEVYLTTHLELGVPRAIKIAHRDMPGFGSSRFDEAFDRFRQEAQIGARIKHDHIIQVHDFERGEESLYLIMEYAAGGSLEDRLVSKQETGKLFSTNETIQVLRDVAAGLAVLHDKRSPIIHRDLKPSNILFDSEGNAKIADLGLAQVPGGLSQRSRLGSVAQPHPGTPAYMSPEQENGFAMLRPTSDVYALGVIVFEMLTGVNYKMQPPGTQLVEFRDDLPQPLISLLDSMLINDIEQRLWDGQRVFSGLETILEQQKEKTAEEAIKLHPPKQSEPIQPEVITPSVVKETNSAKPTDSRVKTPIAHLDHAKKIESDTLLNRLMNYGDSQVAEILSDDKVPEAGDSPETNQNTIAEPTPPAAQKAGYEHEKAYTTDPLYGSGVIKSVKTPETVPSRNQPVLAETEIQTEKNPDVKVNKAHFTWPEEPLDSVVSSSKIQQEKETHPLYIIGVILLIGIIIWGIRGIFQTISPAPSTSRVVVETVMVTAVPNVIVVEPTEEITTESAISVELDELNDGVSRMDGMEMVYVSAGSFTMGSENSDAGSDEGPEHEVYLDAYWIDKYEVTNAQFVQFIEETGYETDAEENGCSYISNLDGSFSCENGITWEKPEGLSSTIQGKESYPVVHVSWNDAQAYCQWAGRELPTEAQWEKAARSDDERIYPWGNANPSDVLVNFCDQNCESDWKDTGINDGYARTAPVGSYPSGASPYGVLDMAGNVEEWVNDWYGEDYYASQNLWNNPTGPTSGDYRVLRGGSWNDSGWTVRSYYHYSNYPFVSVNFYGFRCAMRATSP